MAGIPSQTRFGCYIGNIDRSVTIDMLKQVFCQCGTIIDCSLNGREGDPYRFGFIDFATEDDRARAMKYNGFTLVGRKLKVGISKGNVNKPEGFSTGNPGGVGSPGHNSDRMRRGAGGGNPYGVGGEESGMDGGNGLTTQQQIEARLLLQFLQEGKMDPHQLSPAQQQLLIAALGQGAQSPSPMPAMGSSNAPVNPMMMPQPTGNPMMMMDGMGGPSGYLQPPMMMQQPPQRQQQAWGGGGMSAGSAGGYPPIGAARYPTPPQPQPQLLPQQQPQQMPYGASGVAILGGAAPVSVNPLPTPDTLRLREKQREQFFDVVRRETEKYERKVHERAARAAAGGGADRSNSSASDEDEKPSKKSKRDGE